ncbi:HEPN domain-containing protein [Pseudoalteromonas piscicida]|uniref:HEPN domain-containing protein n=1 Tax=Pseudoalteromonas piscicida TaxID=43662 RepID=UPI0027E5B2A1|nr:HEPN domain-containing protein [Pseudoalteromonas piscicida]WMO16138.1 HEPN domain-containing protein [Pseudoalteromonas piscicida]
MKLSKGVRETFTKLLTELARTFKVWKDDPIAFFQNETRDSLIFPCIDSPYDLMKEISEKRDGNKPCIYQLYHTLYSQSLVKELAVFLHKVTPSCLQYELKPIIEAIAYEYINSDLDGFTQTVIYDEKLFDVQFQTLEKIVNRRITTFTKEFDHFVYQFPVTIFNLSDEIKLSKNILLKPIHENVLTEKQLELYKDTRSFNYNYYLEIFVPIKCSEKLSLKLAEKARDATYNLLKLLATRLSPKAIPLVASNDRSRHRFDFHTSGKDKANTSISTTHRFHSFQADSKQFWQAFNKERTSENNLIDTSFMIPELLLTPNFSSQRVVDRMERALIWYGDASTEPNYYQQIQKLVSSIESIVNYRERDLTETFKRRVTHLHITHNGLSKSVEDKAAKLYKARSYIVHGSSIDERLDYCIVDFCSETLIRAIYYISQFGFEETGFNNKLPKFLDDLPIRAKLQCD